MAHPDTAGSTIALALLFVCGAALTQAQSLERSADALLAIDQQRASVVERIVDDWGAALAKSGAHVSVDELRERLLALRADRLLAAGLAGTLEGLREVIGVAGPATLLGKPGVGYTKALGDSTADVVYTPVTPCRLVETRGTFAAVYQGNGTAAHTPLPFTPNQMRSYTLQGGNGVCLTQLPAGLNASAVQLQVFGMPTTSASGDIEILPQGAAFGSTATMVYVGTIGFNTVSTATRVNVANHQISVQVRGGGAHLAIDVVGYFAAPSGNGGAFFRQGGNAFGTAATLGTTDNQPLDISVNGQRVVRYEPNATSSNILGGHTNNSVNAAFHGQTIGGGGYAGNNCSEPSTGLNIRSCGNRTAGTLATIGGGLANIASATLATVAGGESKKASDLGAAAIAGMRNTASAIHATVSGGFQNTASGFRATVAGGGQNTASGSSATVSGGSSNVASALGATVGGGQGNLVSGSDGTVVGGRGNVAGVQSLAAGINATAAHVGCFVWADSSDLTKTSCFQNNEFIARSLGGFYFFTGGATDATYTGAQLLPGAGAWSVYSDRASKGNIARVDPLDVLDKLVSVPIATWNWSAQSEGIRHIGPMAQDFHAAFGFGENETSISTVDADGVALAAIQGLHQLVQEKDARIGELERRLAGVESVRNELVVMKSLIEELQRAREPIATR